MFAKHHLRSGFRVIAATAVVAGAVMNLATTDRDSGEHVSRGVVVTPL
jgi:hypothetical protein